MANKKHLALLKQGERAWNQWRKTNHEIKPDLRGQSFEGKNLSGADFSYADIRSADFTNAKLIGANFTGAKAGLQRRWAAFLVVISCMLSCLSGFLSIFIGILLASFYSKNTDNIIIAAVCLVLLIVFFIVTIRKSLTAGLRALAVLIAVVFVGVFAQILGITIFVTGAVSIAFAFVFAATGVVIGAITVAVAIAVAGTRAGVFAFAFAFTGAISAAVIVAIINTRVIPVPIALTVTVTVAIAFMLLSTYIGWRSLTGDEKYAWIRSAAIAFAATGGTSFRGADLTDADFTSATLKSTDFKKANLTRTCWRNAKQLNRVRPGTTYLQNEQLRQLIITGKGKTQNFEQFDLRGLNLSGANLENASLIDTDFYQSNLQGANLSEAILVRSNFERADLRNANLTGSCIQDWIITESTKLDGIICDHVFLRCVNNKSKRDQMPPRGKFKAGGFVTFVRYILETVELYHEQDINPRLALTVLQKMSRDYDKPFDIVALGKKGERVFIQVKVSENIIRENFKDDYYSRYDNDLKLWSGKNHQLPPAVNSFIERRISQIALERTDDFVFVDATYVAGNYTEIKGEVNMSGDRNIHMGSGNYNERIDGNYIQGNYYAPEQKQTLAEAAAEIQQLLTQLQSQGCSPEDAQHRAANDLATKAKNDPTTKEKLVKWGQSLGDTAAQTTVSEAAKEVVKLALRLLGVPLP